MFDFNTGKKDKSEAPLVLGGVRENVLEGILALVEDTKDREFFTKELKKIDNPTWKNWIARWLILDYFYPEYDSKKLRKMFSKVKTVNKLKDKKLEYILADVHRKEFMDDIVHIERMAEAHNMKISIEGNSVLVKAFEFMWEDPIEVLRKFKEAEIVHAAEHAPLGGKSGKKIVIKDWDSLDILKEYKGGLYWVDLHSNFCREEAENAGHCGTAPEGSNLISLRSLHGRKGFEYFNVCVTLVLAKNGYLTQAKGRANTPTHPKYKKYVNDFLIFHNECIGTELAGSYLQGKGNKPQDESLAIVGNKKDLDYLLDNRKKKFDFVDLFVKLLIE